jgi:hypothetical protein
VARIVLGSYMVRYPLGGMMSYVLQYLVGFQRLGHEVFFVEKSGWDASCYNPVTDRMSNDCSYGVEVVNRVLGDHGLGDRWCYVDAAGTYRGLSKKTIEAIFRTADVFIDMGTHGSWLEEAAKTAVRVFVDAEPGMRQMKMQNALDAGEPLPSYDFYYTKGRSIATGRSSAPTAGLAWRAMFHPVVTEQFAADDVAHDSAPFTTVMNWQAYEPVQFRGAIYGHKDVEFDKFIRLPSRIAVPIEVAVAGKKTPTLKLIEHGWRVRSAHAVTATIESFKAYIGASRGEFSVCKNGFVALRTGWFSDRSAAYLASGRPVVMQDTGFGEHLPLGRGLFAVQNLDEAAAAIESITANYARHSRWARELALEYLESVKVLARFLDELGAPEPGTESPATAVAP